VFSIHQLAELIVKLTSAKSKLCFEPLPSGDPRQRRADTSEAKLNLKLEPNTRLREYLTKAIAYFDNILRMGLSTRPRALSSAPVWASL
jgi:UDP-glucuronate decarboxylase